MLRKDTKMLNSSRKGRIRRGLKEVIENMESTINICYYCCFHWSKFLRKKWRREVAGLGKIKKRGGKKMFLCCIHPTPYYVSVLLAGFKNVG